MAAAAAAECERGGPGPAEGRGSYLFFPKGPVEPVAEHQDEFPPRGHGGTECRTPAHRSRDGERSGGSGTWEGSGQERGRRTQGPGGHLPRPTVGPHAASPFASLSLQNTPSYSLSSLGAAPTHRGGSARLTAAASLSAAGPARGWSVQGAAREGVGPGQGWPDRLPRPSRPRASPRSASLFAGVSSGRVEPEVRLPLSRSGMGLSGGLGLKPSCRRELVAKNKKTR